MLRINDLKIPYTQGEDAIKAKLLKALRLKPEELLEMEIVKESIDARDKKDILKAYSIEFTSTKDDFLLEKNKTLQVVKPKPEVIYKKGSEKLSYRPTVIGSGPAGLFCAYVLALNGYNPLIIERGRKVEDRDKDVDRFWKKGILDTESNVQFGEGGAGTYSDGKLTTRIKDANIGIVLQTLVRNGAPKEILYKNKPHVGTDVLKNVVANIREEIISMGGEFRFESKLKDLIVEGERLRLTVGDEVIESDVAVLAIGHSARDTFEMLHERGLSMEAKPFAVGVRIEHKQVDIDANQYSDPKIAYHLGAAEYKLTYKASNDRSVYSFCMCPGGRVIAASSEEGMLCVNGMSYHARSDENANSAILVSVNPDDFEGDSPLRGMYFQRDLERKAFEAGGGNYNAPAQTLGSFLRGKENQVGSIKPSYAPGVRMTDIGKVLPRFVCNAINESMGDFGRKIRGFDHDDAVITAVESRSSSPVRLIRNEFTLESVNFPGVYPAGEGAGYAGGITSSAVDGIRIAAKIIEKYGNK